MEKTLEELLAADVATLTLDELRRLQENVKDFNTQYTAYAASLEPAPISAILSIEIRENHIVVNDDETNKFVIDPVLKDFLVQKIKDAISERKAFIDQNELDVAERIVEIYNTP